MHYSEIIFFGCFIAFIVGILLLDLLVIDKEAHEVSMKEAGTWTAVWITLALAFSAFLWFHGDLVHGIHNMSDLQLVVSKYADHMKLNPNDFEGSVQMYRQHMTIAYITGYLIEKTLSVDNLFVMMMIFTSFGVKKKDYQRVLNWGILGAIIMRFIFIFLGAVVIRQFDWILIVFGGFLLYSGVKMFIDRNKDESHVDVEHHPVVKLLRKYFPFISPLMVTVIFIEFSDLIFAFDSIPAVFSVSLDPYVVFFSNIFAILGLRAMFFLLAGVADRFRYLKPGVCVLLIFIGVKLLIHKYVVIGTIESLIFILAVLTVSIGLTLVIPEKKKLQ